MGIRIPIISEDATEMASEESSSPKFRSSITPGSSEQKPTSSGVNIGRVIKEYGPTEIQEIDARIKRTELLLEDLKMERDFILKLVGSVDEYYDKLRTVKNARQGF